MNWRLQRGAAAVTSLLALPVLGLLLGGAIQLTLIYQAKITLNHAVESAARSAAVNNADSKAIYQGLARGLLPLFVSSKNYRQLQTKVYTEILPELTANACIVILSPSKEAFMDFDQTPADPKKDNQISYYELSTGIRHKGSMSGATIQDAMVLRLYVVYGAKANVPVVGPLITRLMAVSGKFSPFKLRMLLQNRVPVTSYFTTQMYSNAKLNALVAGTKEGISKC